MQNTPFHAYLAARRLAGLANSETLLPVFASSSIEVYPYQIAAARFALRSPYIKGCILCDEGSLGKTYESLLIATQKWYEGKDRLLLVLPLNLVNQWVEKIENGFTLPYSVWNSGDEIPDSDGLIIVTYDFAVRHADAIAAQMWDVIIFDEADVLFRPENKTVSTLKAATDSSFKLLLTPTPITMSIMDIYGLIHFIDESVLPDADEFYKRYFRKPENYPELTSWVSQFAFRTLKSQVSDYVNFTERLPLTLNYELTPLEKALYTQVESYLALPKKAAFPQMDKYELTLMLYHTLSSSPQAFSKTIDGTLARLDDGDEKNLLLEIKTTAENIAVSGKITALSSVLKDSFTKLKQLKLPQKAVVFVDNLTTLGILSDMLAEQGYCVITNSEPDYAKRFRNESTAVLIATDTAAKGLDMEFCPVVINYDMLYNAIEMEQRISRCHRQGQKSDVLVISLICKDNFSDVRILELINKRVLQFDGIFGMSDAIVGNFDATIEEVLSQLRKPDEIKDAFKRNLVTHEDDNKRLISHAEDTLFTTFTKAIADKVTVTPQYIADKSATIDTDLWELARRYFAMRDDYEIDGHAKIITLKSEESPRLFYYWTGSRNKPYTGLKKYGLGQNFKPGSGRIALASVLTKGIISETACADSGSITVVADIEPCEIGLYEVGIISNRAVVASYDVLVGKTQSGEILSDEQCADILASPVTAYMEDGESTSNWLRNTMGSGRPHPLDRIVPADALIQRYISENDTAQAEEVERIKLRAMRKKTALEHSLSDLRMQIKPAKQELSAQSGDRMKELTIGKRLKLLEKDLRGKEQNLFFEQMQVDVAAEEEIAAITSAEKYEARIKRQFVIRVEGNDG